MQFRTRKRADPEELKRTVDYFSEINSLKRTSRSGWRFAGPTAGVEPDYVASHVTIVAQLAYILARMEGLSHQRALKCAGLVVFHDNLETRLGERDKIASLYQEMPKELVSRAAKDQTDQLPEKIGKQIHDFIMEANFGKSKEAVIARDADILEASFQAKIFHERGFRIDENFLVKYLDPKRVTTTSAKQLMESLNREEEIATRWLTEALQSV